LYAFVDIVDDTSDDSSGEISESMLLCVRGDFQELDLLMNSPDFRIVMNDC